LRAQIPFDPQVKSTGQDPPPGVQVLGAQRWVLPQLAPSGQSASVPQPGWQAFEAPHPQAEGSQTNGADVAASKAAQSESTWHSSSLRSQTPWQNCPPGGVQKPSIVQSDCIQHGPPIPPAPS
jgi:hypothetical protein